MIGKELYERLRKERLKEDLLMLGVLVSLALAFGIIATLGAVLSFSPWFYTLLTLPIGLAILYLLRRPGLYALARKFEQRDERWQDRLSTAVDLSAKRNPREVYSKELTSDYVESLERRLAEHSLSLKRERRLFGASLGILAGSSLILLLFVLLFPTRFSFGITALFAIKDLPLRIESIVSDTLLNPGQRIEVSAQLKAPIKLGYLFLERNRGRDKKTQKVRVTAGIASTVIRVDEEETIRFERFGHRSDEVYLGLNQPFEIRGIEFTVSPPIYTGEKPREFGGLRFSALLGSQVRLEGRASVELREGSLRVGDSLIPLEVQGKEFSARFNLLSREDIKLLLKNRQGSQFEQPIDVTIRPDEPPLVGVFLPGKDTDVNRSMSLTLGVHLLDDYGLNDVRLVSTNGKSSSLVLARPVGKVEDTIFYLWDLTGLDLLPGDEIVYFVEASDNDVVSGPKLGRSRSYRLRFPKITELFSDVTEYGTQTATSLAKVSERQGKLGLELSRLEEKLRSEQELSPEETQRLREIIENQKELLSDVDSLARETQKLLEKLDATMGTDPATIEKLSSLSRMLAELMPPELKRKLSDLASALESDPKRLAEELKKTSELSSEMQLELEQALEVIKRFLEEERLAELAEKASALARMEEDLIRKSDSLSSEEAAARQKEIEEGIKEVAKQAEELAKSIDNEEISKALEELASKMSGENSELSRDVEGSIRQGNMNRRKAENLERNLRQAGLQLSQMAFNLQRSRMESLKQEMANLARELLILSEEQEKLVGKLGTVENLELAARATELERALEKGKEDLFQLASQSFKVPRDAMHELASASRSESEFKQSLIEGKSGTAREHGRSAQHSVDQAASSLLEAFAESSGAQGSSTGLEELLESLSSMSLVQLSINQRMGGLLPLPISVDMTAAQRQALSRLAAEQAALRQELEELNQAAGEEPGFSGILEGIIEEMKRLEEDMSRYVGEREFVQRGEQIFRRLLDARNVLRKKEDTQRREREIGSVWEKLTSPSLPQDAGERQLWLKKELVRFLRSDYPEEYKRLARAYLEALLEQE